MVPRVRLELTPLGSQRSQHCRSSNSLHRGIYLVEQIGFEPIYPEGNGGYSPAPKPVSTTAPLFIHSQSDKMRIVMGYLRVLHIQSLQLSLHA